MFFGDSSSSLPTLQLTVGAVPRHTTRLILGVFWISSPAQGLGGWDLNDCLSLRGIECIVLKTGLRAGGEWGFCSSGGGRGGLGIEFSSG